MEVFFFGIIFSFGCFVPGYGAGLFYRPANVKQFRATFSRQKWQAGFSGGGG
jgi:hypothetical protein